MNKSKTPQSGVGRASSSGKKSPGLIQESSPSKKENQLSAVSDPNKEDRSVVSAVNLARLTKKELQELVRVYSSSLDDLKKECGELRGSLGRLEESQSRLKELYDFSPVGYFTLDGAGVILTANLTGAKMLCQIRENLSHKTFSSFVHNEDLQIFDLHVRNLQQEGDAYQCELRLQGEHNSFFYARLESTVARDDSGKIVEIRVSVSDVTDQKQIEGKLDRKGAVLRAIIDATDFMLVYLDRDFNYVWVNPAYAESCKMQPGDMAGRNHFEFFSNQENETIFCRVRDTGRPVFYKDQPFEFPDQPERGVTYWDWSLMPYENAAGKVTGLVLSLRETTHYKRAEMELAESEERFRRITETSPDIIFQMDTEGRFTYCSPAIGILGYSSGQVVGNSFSEFIPDNEWPTLEKALQLLNKGESISLFEVRILKADQSVADFEISATPVIKGGNVIGVQGVARDINERKRTEKALRKNQAQLQTVFNNMHEGLVVADLAGNLIQWNSAAVAIHGFHSEEEYLRGLPEFADRFQLSTETEGTLPFEQWPMMRILRGETLDNWEVTVRRLDVDWRRTFSYGGTLARDDDGRPLLAMLTFSDITERKWVERQLLQAKVEWEKTFDSVPDLITILDSRHRIIRANRAMSERLGISPAQCIGLQCFSCVHGESGPPAGCPHIRTMSDGREHMAEVYEERLGGYFLVTTTPLLDEEGNFVATVHVARDITERKRAEEQIRLLNQELQKSIDKLEDTNRELERSNWDLEQFVNIASHDLQEPLRTISSFMQLLKRRYSGKLDEKADTFIDFAVEGTSHMQKLINDLLAFSRLGGGELLVRPIALQSVVDNLRLSLKTALEEGQAEIITGNLPIVHADEGQITHLLQNLITNAVKFRGEDLPRIYIFSEQTENETVICVRDNGIGIDPQHVERIFLIFQRLHRRGEYTGTGIGLAISKKIVERHGGRIWVESVPGQGTTFCFSLPREKQ